MQGNIIALIDSSGTTVVQYNYDAWGNHKVVDANGNDIESGIGVLNPFRYRGYYYDTETGLYYLKTRYYDPEVGRFISQDSIEYANPEVLNGINLYAYCSNNPVIYEDPTGHSFWNSFLKVFVGVVVVVATAALAVATAGTAIGTITAGAAVGAAIGFAGGGVSGAISAGLNGTNVFEGFANGALSGSITGAVSGAVAGSSIGLGGQILVNSAIGGIEYTASTIINGEGFDVADFVISMGAGVFSGLAGGKGATAGLNSLFKTVLIKELFNRSTSTITKIIKPILKSSFVNLIGSIVKAL